LRCLRRHLADQPDPDERHFRLVYLLGRSDPYPSGAGGGIGATQDAEPEDRHRDAQREPTTANGIFRSGFANSIDSMMGVMARRGKGSIGA